MRRDRATALPTTRQRTVLGTLSPSSGRTARWMGVRSDVLWRMEELGWVTGSIWAKRTPDERWRITADGRAALHRAMVKLGLEEE